MGRLTEKRDGQNVIPLRQDGKLKWTLNSAGMGDAPTQFLYGVHADKLAEYEDLEEQGKMLKLPCKIGDTIYVIPSRANCGINIVNRHKENNRVYEQIVDHITFYKSGYLLSTCEGHACVIEESYKETWFLTKEEAETALRKLKDVWKELEG